VQQKSFLEKFVLPIEDKVINIKMFLLSKMILALIIMLKIRKIIFQIYLSINKQINILKLSIALGKKIAKKAIKQYKTKILPAIMMNKFSVNKNNLIFITAVKYAKSQSSKTKYLFKNIVNKFIIKKLLKNKEIFKYKYKILAYLQYKMLIKIKQQKQFQTNP